MAATLSGGEAGAILLIVIVRVLATGGQVLAQALLSCADNYSWKQTPHARTWSKSRRWRWIANHVVWHDQVVAICSELLIECR